MDNLKAQIQSALNQFANGNLSENALALFNKLGYSSNKKIDFTKAEFERQFAEHQTANAQKAFFDDWLSADYLFQLTEEEITRQKSLFLVNQYNPNEYQSYSFVAIELKNEHYARGRLSQIAREVNKLFPMPAMILFKHGNTLTLSIINRRLHKRDENKDVLEKVTLIKDIRISPAGGGVRRTGVEVPLKKGGEGVVSRGLGVVSNGEGNVTHRAHIEILFDLSFDELKNKHGFTNFVELHDAWQKTLDIKELNQKFYKELSTWYYYATSTIKLPLRPEYCSSDKENVKNFTVRLICRIIFCWFLKEKGLIDENLLEIDEQKDKILRLLKYNTHNDFYHQNSYYRGILQNIFFASLNTPMVHGKGRSKKEYFGKQYLSDDFDYSLFDKIPYLNGGLFEKLEEDNCNEIIDDEVIHIPNELFYAGELTVGTGRNTKRTCGLNLLLSQYKFTVDENTPLEEEIALDPELLGLVFENLLAEIGPDETVAKTARRESGSFYTPRKVIDYMVNESLLLYLKNYISQKASYDFTKDTQGFNQKLQNLIYFDKVDLSDKSFQSLIIEGLDNIRVLDPACGSGAFLMGILHKMVTVLLLVDENNEIWIEKQLQKLSLELREQARKDLNRHELNFARKLGLIRNCIYGIDNQPMAVMITKLRFFISLLIEQDIDFSAINENYHISPLPNLETKIICADSLQDAQPDLFKKEAAIKLLAAKEKYYQNQDMKGIEKELLIHDIINVLSECFPDFAMRITGREFKDKIQQEQANKKYLKEWFQHANICAPFFNTEVFFPELNKQGFDIVIGNPPYGGTDIPEELKTFLELGSKDRYGAFIARFLGDGQRPTPLKDKGILSYIVSDTFMTIKSHLSLRKQMMNNYIYKMIRVHPDTFKATVNTAIIICQRNRFPENTPYDKLTISPDHYCQMVDLTNMSIHDQYDRFLEVLYKTEGFEVRQNYSSSEYAIYFYPQILIKTNGNLPFFVASPKLFKFMQNVGVKTLSKKVGDKKALEVRVRQIEMNGRTIEVFRFGDVADSPHGISTGNNKRYVRALPDTRGGYDLLEDWMIMPQQEMLKLTPEEKIRGVKKEWQKLTACFVPFEKGGESETDDGWLPNYYVPTRYYINWAHGAIEDMRRNPGFAWKNERFFFKNGLTFSISGVYAPTFRLNSCGVFEAKGSGIFSDALSNERMLGVLCSKISKYIFKNFIKHTVDTSGDDIAEFVFVLDVSDKVIQLVTQILEKQQQNQRYSYFDCEQPQIDKLIYEAYGLNEEDIVEVENWYARRYPKLAKLNQKNQTS